MLAIAGSMFAIALSLSGAREARHFDDLTSDLPHEPITAVAVDPTNDAILFAGLDGFLYKSIDGGERWRPVLSFPRGIAIDDSVTEVQLQGGDNRAGEDAIAAGGGSGVDPLLDDDPRAEEDGDVDRDDERGDSFLDASTVNPADVDAELPDGDLADPADVIAFARAAAGVRAIRFVPNSPGVVWVATPRGLYRSTTSGDSWQRIVLPGGALENDVRDVAVDPARPSRLYIATAAGLKVSPDGGATVVSASGRIGTTPALCAATGRASDGVVVLIGTEQGLFRSIDGGATFLEVLLRGLSPRAPVVAVAFQEDGETTFAGTARGLWVGERSYALLERYGGVPPQLVQAISPDPRRKRAVIVGTRQVGVLYSSDAGLTIDQAEQVPAAEVFSIARGKDAAAVLVGTERGIFRSVKGTGVTVAAGAIKRLREVWKREPSLERATMLAIRAAGVDLDQASSMASRAGIARLLPRAQLRYDGIAGRVDRTRDFVLPFGELPPTVDPDRDDVDLFGTVGLIIVEPSEGILHRGLITLTWDLDRLILNQDEVAVGRGVPGWWARERSVVNKVQTLYAARRRLMTDIVIGPLPTGKRALEKEITRQLRLDELTAELDALTAGEFSRFIEEEGRQ